MLNLQGVKGNQNWSLFWFELAGVSWSEFAAGTLRAQLGHFEVESGRLNLAETRVRSVPGEGLEPSRGKPSQDFKSCASSLVCTDACTPLGSRGPGVPNSDIAVWGVRVDS